MKEPEPLQQVDRTYVRLQGRKLSYFAGCDYFRLSSHPAVLRALSAGAKRFGLSVAASRLTTGNHKLYGDLEAALAAYFGAESAVLAPTGYLTNLIVAQALSGSFSHALVDERAHPALVDAAALLECPVLRFAHRGAADLERTATRCGPGARLILLTDGMFSHDGSVAPLAEYLQLLPADAVLLVDDAHGAGVLGRKGQGAIEETGVARERVVQTIALSKAFGAYGGAVLGTASLRRKIMERSRIFSGSTPLPLPLVNAALQSLALLRQANGVMQERLRQKAGFVKTGLRAAGWPVPDHPGPIISFIPKSERLAAELTDTLLASAIHPPLIKYHGGPKAGYFRFVISSEHTTGQLRALLGALEEWPALR